MPPGQARNGRRGPLPPRSPLLVMLGGVPNLLLGRRRAHTHTHTASNTEGQSHLLSVQRKSVCLQLSP